MVPTTVAPRFRVIFKTGGFALHIVYKLGFSQPSRIQDLPTFVY
jgi:hypothetical protein